MIVHPFLARERLQVCGGRLLVETFNLVGIVLGDVIEPQREWTIDGLYSPIWGRALGGIRARVRDQKGFVSFINQRDLEFLLGIGTAGKWCSWLGEDYVDPTDRRWVGFCTDEEDLKDDLYARELDVRFHQEELTGSPVLPEGLEIDRLLGINGGTDVKELLTLRLDYDPLTGEYPDRRFTAVDTRWARIEREKFPWHRA